MIGDQDSWPGDMSEDPSSLAGAHGHHAHFASRGLLIRLWTNHLCHHSSELTRNHTMHLCLHCWLILLLPSVISLMQTSSSGVREKYQV